MKFKRQFNQKYKGTTTAEKNTLPSETIPDQAMSIHELLRNHTRGIESDVKDYKGEYFEETEIPIFDDLTDLQEFREKLQKQEKELEAQIKAEKAEKIKKDADIKKTAKDSQSAPRGAQATPNTNLEQVPDQGQDNKGT